MISSKNSLLEDDALGLKLYGLQEVSKLELYTGQFCNAGSYLFVHGTCDLEQCVDALTIKFESSLE